MPIFKHLVVLTESPVSPGIWGEGGSQPFFGSGSSAAPAAAGVEEPAGADAQPFASPAAVGEVPSNAVKLTTAAEGQGAAQMAEAHAGAGGVPSAEASVAASAARARAGSKGAGPKKGKVLPKASGVCAAVHISASMAACRPLAAFPIAGA